MTKREFVSIALKLMAVYAVITAVGTATASWPSLWLYFSRQSLSGAVPTWILLMSLVPLVSQIGLAILLWLMSDGISRSIVTNDQTPAAKLVYGAEIKHALVAVLGIWLVCSGIIDVARAVASLAFDNSRFQTAGYYGFFFGGILKSLMGVVVYLWSRNTLRGLTSRRDWGRDTRFDAANNESQTPSK
jgi:hypothetical protein